jgi:hypothetical protein
VEFFPTKDENKINESSKKQKEMKKNILKATLVAAFGLIAGFNVYNSQKSDVMSDLALANVEALADDGETLTPTECPGGRHLCQWIIYPGGSVTYYDRNGEDTI